MRAVGVIVEYNPFHNGHYYHLQQSRKITDSEAVVAVMSGNFLQRGEPAMADKWTRTRMALAGGCDLVIELPVAYATQAAEWFGYGAVSLLEATGVVDSFCFGTESGDLAPLHNAAKLVAEEPPIFRSQLKERLQRGCSYPQAYSDTLTAFINTSQPDSPTDFRFDLPNHTLGLHYMIAHERIGGTMTPYTIAREKSDYNQETISDEQIASATALRKLILEQQTLAAIQNYVPPSSFQILSDQYASGHRPIHWDLFIRTLLHQIIISHEGQLRDIHEVTEGLEYRLLNELPHLSDLSFDALINALKTKRYTRTKLQRALLAILLGHTKADFTRDKLASGVQYIRVLGFSDKGRQLLKSMRKKAALPILLSAARPPQPYRYLELDTQASNIYMLGRESSLAPGDLFRDFRDRPIMF